MAQIVSTSEKKVYQIQRWLGLNESPDGDTHMKMGEAAVMRNFRITRESHLQIRPGYGTAVTLAAGRPVRGLWSGYVGGVFHVVAACGGSLWDVDLEEGTAQNQGAIDDSDIFFFDFADQLYLLTGTGYYSWDGSGEPVPVEGYVPIVSTAVPPGGGGTQMESVNLLTGKRRAQFSPDGSTAAFQLPETAIDEVLSVEGTDKTWTADTAKGTVTFSAPPDKGVNTVTITWRKGDGERARVAGMRFAELYNGQNDSRVFLYGDGSNTALYSGLDEHGRPTAEYFPALNELAVDSENTPITAMLRHYDRLLIFKPDSTYSCAYDTMGLETGAVTAAFTVSPLNRAVGNAAPGQARLVDNSARTLFSRSVYQWSLASGAVRDERNAKRISDKVADTLGRFRLEDCLAFDDEWNHEYYLFCDGQAVVNNYGNDTWYYYNNLPVSAVTQVKGTLFFGTPDGAIMEFSRRFHSDNQAEIDAYWESGSMDFDMDWRRKYSALLWIAIKPESQAMIHVTAQSNIKSSYPIKIISAGLSTFLHANFAHWSFGVNRKPQLIRAKLKVKKATYYKLILFSRSASSTATVLSMDFQVRYTGNVK